MHQFNEIEIKASREKLIKSFGSSPDLVFIRAWGNIGDELIYGGIRQLLSGIDYREVSIQNLENESGHTALISGSGGWCKQYHVMPSFMQIIEERFESVIVFPSSFETAENIVKNTLMKTKALIFAREVVSYNLIKGLCQSDIAYDCAFYFNYEKYMKVGNGTLNAFRSDIESTNKPLPDDNNDISATSSSLDEWLWTISNYDVIRTDRAHVMIAGAMLGKRVEYSTSKYHEVPAIADFSLKGFPVTRIHEEATFDSVLSTEGVAFISSQVESKSNLIGQIEKLGDFFAERSGSSDVLLVDDLDMLDLDYDFQKESIVIISNAFSSLKRKPHLTKLLKNILQKVQRIFLFEKIYSSGVDKIEIFLKSQNLPVEFIGFAKEHKQKTETLAIICSEQVLNQLQTPANFRVVAIISTYNEEDIIIPTLNQLIDDGIEIYLIDNWSTDETYRRAKTLLGKGLIGLEKFPIEGSSSTFDLIDILKRKEEISQELE